MPTSFAFAKTTIPTLNLAHYIKRPRLTNMLMSLLEKRLGLICAPVGFGKTSLCCEWVSQLETERLDTRVAWLRLDPYDNDSLSLMLGLLYSTANHIDCFDKLYEALAACARTDMRSFAIAFSNALAANSKDCHLVIVLDQFHHITDQNALESIDLLLDCLPSKTHMLLTSCVQLDRRFIRFKAENELVSINAQDLTLNIQEARQLFNPGTSAFEQLMVDTHERFGGWPSGWHIIAAALNSGVSLESHSFVTLASDIRSLAKFFVHDIMASYTPHMSAFINETIHMSRICAPLCDAMLDTRESNEIIQQLVASGLLHHSEESKYTWYSYYPLFAESIIDMSATCSKNEDLNKPSRKASLLRAATWFMNNNMPIEAVKSTIQSNNIDAIEKLVRNIYRILIMRGIPEPVQSFLGSLDNQQLNSHPWLNLMLAWQANQHQDAIMMRKHIVQIIANTPALIAVDSDKLLIDCAVMNAIYESHQGDPEKALAIIRHARTLVPPDDDYLLSHLSGSLASARSRLYGARKAIDTLYALKFFEKDLRNHMHISYHDTKLADEFIRMGQIGKAENLLKQSVIDTPLRGAASIGMRYATIAKVYYLTNNISEAQNCLNIARPFVERTDMPELRIMTYICDALLRYQKRNFNTALQQLMEARIVADRFSLPILQLTVANVMSVMHANTHGIIPTSLMDWVNSVHVYSKDLEVSRMKALICARWHLLRYENAKAVEVLSPILRKERALGHKGNLTPLLVLQGIGFARQGKMRNARQLLQELIEIVKSGVGVRILLDEENNAKELFACVFPLLQPELLGKRKYEFGMSLMHQLGVDTQISQKIIISTGGLSRRECEIARLIVNGMSNSEIAEHFCISLNTVKTHRKHIYAKLKVTNTAELCNIWKTEFDSNSN